MKRILALLLVLLLLFSGMTGCKPADKPDSPEEQEPSVPEQEPSPEGPAEEPMEEPAPGPDLLSNKEPLDAAGILWRIPCEILEEQKITAEKHKGELEKSIRTILLNVDASKDELQEMKDGLEDLGHRLPKQTLEGVGQYVKPVYDLAKEIKQQNTETEQSLAVSKTEQEKGFSGLAAQLEKGFVSGENQRKILESRLEQGFENTGADTKALAGSMCAQFAALEEKAQAKFAEVEEGLSRLAQEQSTGQDVAALQEQLTRTVKEQEDRIEHAKQALISQLAEQLAQVRRGNDDGAKTLLREILQAKLTLEETVRASSEQEQAQADALKEELRDLICEAAGKLEVQIADLAQDTQEENDEVLAAVGRCETAFEQTKQGLEEKLNGLQEHFMQLEEAGCKRHDFLLKLVIGIGAANVLATAATIILQLL